MDMTQAHLYILFYCLMIVLNWLASIFENLFYSEQDRAQKVIEISQRVPAPKDFHCPQGVYRHRKAQGNGPGSRI